MKSYLTVIVDLIFQSTTYGMLFAFGYQVAKRFHLFDDSKGETLFSKSMVSWTLCGFSVIGLLVSFTCVCWVFHRFLCHLAGLLQLSYLLL